MAPFQKEYWLRIYRKTIKGASQINSEHTSVDDCKIQFYKDTRTNEADSAFIVRRSDGVTVETWDAQAKVWKLNSNARSASALPVLMLSIEWASGQVHNSDHADVKSAADEFDRAVHSPTNRPLPVSAKIVKVFTNEVVAVWDSSLGWGWIQNTIGTVPILPTTTPVLTAQKKEVTMYYTLIEEAENNGEKVYIYLRQYQKFDALEKFVKARNRNTISLSSKGKPATWTEGGELNLIEFIEHEIWKPNEGIWQKYQVEARPIYTAGYLIGWTEARKRGLKDGWSDPKMHPGVDWTTNFILGEVEPEILALKARILELEAELQMFADVAI